jgi:glycosyltransferase involved in cell wall biosynthesis
MLLGAGPVHTMALEDHGKRVGLTVVIPVRNEGGDFRLTYTELIKFIPEKTMIAVVYDTDDDTTIPILRALAAKDPRLIPVRNRLGPGIPNALRTGFEVAETGPVLVMMGDLSDDLKVISEMLLRYGQGAQVVCPSRYMPGGVQVGGALVKKTLSRLAGLSLYWMGCLPVRDATNNFRLYDAQFLKSVRIESTHGFEVALELTVKAVKAGLKVVEIPTVWRDRTWGQSNFRLFRSLPHYLKWWFRSVGGRWPWARTDRIA